MKLSELFEKPIDRQIEGVIKADDVDDLKLELEEYVITSESEQRLESFFDAYNDYQGANGVWISGFFGSGKSHLLKMLALIIESRDINGVSALEIFSAKCKHNPMLKGALDKAASRPSQSILFNIDQKADVISKTQQDALLAVFVKVFDEMCGYFGKQGYIAQFERDLDNRSKYDAFKDAYIQMAKKEWRLGREEHLLESVNISKAYAKALNEDADAHKGILDKYRKDYKVSIEGFAEQVKKYVDSRGKDFRLNFFVDEVGQYIADNIKLMTNLQTIAESLMTKCRGRAWIIVTAQEDMANVIGEMNKQQSNDFSKIQARFANRMQLTSANVDEVIQRRLLAKNKKGSTELAPTFSKEVNNFKTLFDFADGATTYRNFRDEEHFIACYPFIPFQFSLFQACIQALSEHNAFEGRHSSVGERSMLGVFQEVAKQISDSSVGQLATFDLMFEGIRSTIKSQSQTAILVAEKNLDDEFAVKILKVLFLVKYVKGFNATVRNLQVLMVNNFEVDTPALRKKIETAVDLLEQQTYIQRNGEKYEYLTNEEKDIETEIKNNKYEASDITDTLSTMVFDNTLKHKKIRIQETGQDIPFSRKLDDKLAGRESELAIHIISPFHQNADRPDLIKMQSMGKDELYVIMPSEDRLMTDLVMHKKTDKYCRQNITITQDDVKKRILLEKQQTNAKRLAAIQTKVTQLLGTSTLIISGAEEEIPGTNAQDKLTQGFYSLVKKSYPNLKMLQGHIYHEEDVQKYIQGTALTLFSDDTNLSEAEQDMLSFIQQNKNNSIRTTAKMVLEKFEKKPYGWYYAAIVSILAKLYARDKVTFMVDSNILEDKILEKELLNTQAHFNINIDPQPDIPPSKLRALKDFIKEFFDVPPASNEAKALGKEIQGHFVDLSKNLDDLVIHKNEFPFLEKLEDISSNIKAFTKKPASFFFGDFSNSIDDWLDTKESLLDPIRQFMGGSLRGDYLDIKNFCKSSKLNLQEIRGEDYDNFSVLLDRLDNYKGQTLREMKALYKTLSNKVREAVENEKEKAFGLVSKVKAQVEGQKSFNKLSIENQQKVLDQLLQIENEFSNMDIIAAIRDRKQRFDNSDSIKIFNLIETLLQEERKPDDPDVDEPTVAPIEYVSIRDLDVKYDSPVLQTEDDVEKYLGNLRDALNTALNNSKRIKL